MNITPEHLLQKIGLLVMENDMLRAEIITLQNDKQDKNTKQLVKD